MICTNKSCKWCKDGKCVLFVGVRVFECKYRQTIEVKSQKAKIIKKGK